jgi:hypothetical protein
MGLFKGKQPDPAPTNDANAVADGVFDEQYREELRQVGREHLKSLIDASADDLKRSIDQTMQQVVDDLKQYMTGQLDVIIGKINSDITDQLNERVKEFERLANESQEQASQTLTRNSQAVYEKYQQLTATLQQTVASQEVQMITVFQDNKNRIASAQAEQERVLEELRGMAEESKRQNQQIHQEMKQAATEQTAKLNQIYEESLARASESSQSQEQALQSLKASVQALETKHRELQEFLDKTVAQQKEMMISTINDNMARILEHYLIGALGEQSDLKAQLPSIIEQMEQNKQAMVDDMKL